MDEDHEPRTTDDACDATSTEINDAHARRRKRQRASIRCVDARRHAATPGRALSTKDDRPSERASERATDARRRAWMPSGRPSRPTPIGTAVTADSITLKIDVWLLERKRSRFSWCRGAGQRSEGARSTASPLSSPSSPSPRSSPSSPSSPEAGGESSIRSSRSRSAAPSAANLALTAGNAPVSSRRGARRRSRARPTEHPGKPHPHRACAASASAAGD